MTGKRLSRYVLRISAFCFILFLLVSVIAPANPVLAQTSPSVSISIPDTGTYPNINFYFWPFDSSGNFVADLVASQVHVLENEKEVKITSFSLLEPGMHFILAVNEGPTLANSYAGKPRMDRMKELLEAWIKSESITTLDDFSLVNNTDVLQNQLPHPADWLQALTEYTPDLKKTTPSVTSLAQAVSLVNSIDSSDHKTRAILYITPLPDQSQFQAIQQQADAAKAANTHLFIWLVGPTAYKSEAGSTLLQQAAEETGGGFFIYSGAETLPDLNSYFNPLSHEYQVTYQTTLQTSGTNSIQVQIQRNDYSASSQTVSFDLKASAPNPMLLNPPTEITLNWQKDSAKVWRIVPSTITIQYILEFPDGHTRALKNARLFVDGEQVSEVTSDPFTELPWDLSKYSATGTHYIQVYIEDEAGFSSNTIKMPVLVTINPKPQTALQKFFDGINYLTLTIVVVLAALALFLVLFFGRSLRKKQAIKTKTHKVEPDPVRQQVLPDFEDTYDVSARDLPGDWPQLPGGGLAAARLIALNPKDQTALQQKVIALSLHDATLGSDAIRCDIVFSGPTISPTHARIFTDNARHFFVADCGSGAGTWVNYAPVSSQGTRLEHGDLLNIGALSFRFEEAQPESRPIRVVSPNEE